MKLGLNKKIFLITLTLFIFVDIVSLFLLSNINQIVHGDLYNYGLRFSTDWSYNYWINIDATLITVWTSIFLSIFLIGLLYFRDFKNNKKILITNTIIFLSLAFTAILGIFLTVALDKIVSVDLGLYYGVQYDFQWTQEYFLFFRLFLAIKVVVVAIATSLSSWTILLLLKPKLTTSKLASFSFILTGALSLLFSTLYGILLGVNVESGLIGISLGVNIGLGLIIIGVIIGYITSQEFVKKKNLTTQVISTYQYIEENLKKFGQFDKAVYIPSYLTKENTNTVLILKNTNEKNFKTKTKNSKKIITKAYALIPPGNELLKLFEKKLNINFIKVNMDFLQKNLPNLITEDLEIATDLQIENQKESVTVNFDNSIFYDISFDQKFSEILNFIGCPLSSAIGCVIADATGKLITITEYKTNKQRTNTVVTYKFMEETIKLTYDSLN